MPANRLCMDFAAMETFLDDLKHDILAMHTILGTLDSAWRVMKSQTQGYMPAAFAETSAVWYGRMNAQITVLETLHGILSGYLQNSRDLEARWRNKTNANSSAATV